jgi:hypothetical protein
VTTTATTAKVRRNLIKPPAKTALSAQAPL